MIRKPKVVIPKRSDGPASSTHTSKSLIWILYHVVVTLNQMDKQEEAEQLRKSILIEGGCKDYQESMAEIEKRVEVIFEE